MIELQQAEVAGLGWGLSRVGLDSICERPRPAPAKALELGDLELYVSKEIDQSGGNLGGPPDSSGAVASGAGPKYCIISPDIGNPAASREEELPYLATVFPGRHVGSPKPRMIGPEPGP